MTQKLTLVTPIGVQDEKPTRYEIRAVLSFGGENAWRLTGKILGPAESEMVLAPHIFFTTGDTESDAQSQANDLLRKRAARFLKVDVEKLKPMNTTWAAVSD